MDNIEDYLSHDEVEDEIEIMHLIQEIIDLDQVAEFLLFCGLTNEDILEKAENYLKVAF